MLIWNAMRYSVRMKRYSATGKGLITIIQDDATVIDNRIKYSPLNCLEYH